MIPIVSTLLGIIALGEPLRGYEPVGAAIIVIGAAPAQSRDRALGEVSPPLKAHR